MTNISLIRHGIDTNPGSIIPPDGNCAINSVLTNINERPIFGEQYNDTIDSYRAQFCAGMMNLEYSKFPVIEPLLTDITRY